MHQFKAAILHYLNSLESKNVLKLKKTQLFYLVIKLMKHFASTKGLYEIRTKRAISTIFFRTKNYTDVIENFNEPLMSISDKHNYKISQKVLRGVNYTVTIQEINVIFSAFQTFIFFTSCQQFQFVNNIDLKSRIFSI